MELGRIQDCPFQPKDRIIFDARASKDLRVYVVERINRAKHVPFSRTHKHGPSCTRETCFEKGTLSFSLFQNGVDIGGEVVTDPNAMADHRELEVDVIDGYPKAPYDAFVRIPPMETRARELLTFQERELNEFETVQLEKRINATKEKAWFDGDQKIKLLMIAATEARLLAKLDEVNAENDRLKLRVDNMESYKPAQPRTVPRKVGEARSGQDVPGWKTGGQFYEALKRRMEEGSVWASERQERMKQWKTDQELQAIAASNFSINSMATGAVDVHLDDKMMRFEVDSKTTFELLLDMCNVHWNLEEGQFIIIENVAHLPGEWRGLREDPAAYVIPSLRTMGTLGRDPTPGIPDHQKLYLMYSGANDEGTMLARNPLKFKQFYEDFDVDKSGTFDGLELHDFLKRYFRGKYGVRKALAFKILKQYSTDPDVGMNFADVKRAISDWEIIMDDDSIARLRLSPQAVFDEIEGDSTGDIHVAEFVQAVHIVNQGFPEAKAKKLFKKIDKDGSNSISYDEFSRAWASVLEQVSSHSRADTGNKGPETIGVALRDELGITLPTTKNYKAITPTEMHSMREGLFFLTGLILFIFSGFNRRDIFQNYQMANMMTAKFTHTKFGCTPPPLVCVSPPPPPGGYLNASTASSSSAAAAASSSNASNTRQAPKPVCTRPAYTPRPCLQFHDIHSEREMWMWMKEVVMPIMFDSVGPNGEYKNSNQRQYLFQYNKFAPTPFRMRVRQVRGDQKSGVQCGSGPLNTSTDASVKRTCTSNLKFDGSAPNTDWHGGVLKGLPEKCQNPLATDIYDRTKPVPFAFQYNTTTELNPSTVRVGDAPNYDWAGSVGSYSSGGFSIDLSGPLALDKWTDPQDYTDDLKFRLESTDTVLECLSHRNGWVDEQTRAVMIGFLVFNPTFNFWLQSNYVFEFTRMGIVVPNAIYPGLDVDMFYTNTQMLCLGLESTCAVLALVFLAVKLLEFKEVKAQNNGQTDRACKKWFGFPIILDLSLVFTTVMGRVVLMLYWSNTARTLVVQTVGPPQLFTNWSEMAFYYRLPYMVDSLTIMMLSLKVLSYFAIIRTMRVLLKVVHDAMYALCSFSLMFLVMFYGYAVLAHNIFGSRVLEFTTYSSTIRTLLLQVCGVINYAPMKEANALWGPLFVMVFVLHMTTIMSKVYMVILNSWYHKVNEHERIFNPPDTRSWPVSEVLSVVLPFLGGQIESQESIDAGNAVDARKAIIKKRKEVQAAEQEEKQSNAAYGTIMT